MEFIWLLMMLMMLIGSTPALSLQIMLVADKVSLAAIIQTTSGRQGRNRGDTSRRWSKAMRVDVKGGAGGGQLGK